MKKIYQALSNFIFILSLVVLSACGGGGDKKKTIDLNSNRVPSASFTATPNPADINESVSFDSSNSNDPDSGDSLSYSWQFGDGTSSQETNPVHAYASANTFQVSLTVTDNSGASSNPFTANIEVEDSSSNIIPVARINVSPNPVTQGTAINFDGTDSSDADNGDTLTYVWLFGDGAASTEQNPSHIYSEVGTYVVSLTVTDNHGAASVAAEVEITVLSSGNNNPPTARFTISSDTVAVNVAVTFDSSSSSDPEGDVLSYSWQFGDGNTSTAANPSHQYSSEGTYSVSLIVSDTLGAQSPSTQQSIVVSAVSNAAPVASFTASPNPASVGVDVNFDSTNSSDPDGDPLTYSWDFGDGNTSVSANPIHQYSSVGNFSVSLIVTDDSNASSSAETQTIQIQANAAPTADFSATPNPTTVGATVQFDSGNSSDPEGDVLSFSWDFGDGSSSQSTDPTHSFSTEGSFQVELVVTDSNSNVSLPHTVTITVNAAGDFSGEPEPWPVTRDLNIIWFGASTTKHAGSGSTPGYDIPSLVRDIYGMTLPGGSLPQGEYSINTDGGTSLAVWLGRSNFNLVESGPSNGENWDYVVSTAIKSVEPTEFPSGGSKSVYDALERVENSAKSDVFVNHPVPRLNGFSSDDSEALLTRYECIHTLAKGVNINILNAPMSIAMDTVYQNLPNPELIARLKTYDNFPDSFPEDFDEQRVIFVYDVNPGLDPQHYAQPGSYLVANVFATYLYGINPIGLPLTDFSGMCASQSSSSLCAISDNMRLFLQAIAYDGAVRYRLGERPKRNGISIGCEISDQININGQREDAYLESVFGS
ncbi:MAG: PKD domain-containing protein [Kangiellaceae bacterium]|nr:PKD domain-containing protein [Kangiellaceae bacterium]